MTEWTKERLREFDKCFAQCRNQKEYNHMAAGKLADNKRYERDLEEFRKNHNKKEDN